MMGIRIGGPAYRSEQLEVVAHLSRTYGNGLVHMTTRQDLQLRDMRIESMADVLAALRNAGLSSLDHEIVVVPNVATCSGVGSCPRERFDVTPYARAAAEYLQPVDGSRYSRRELKIAFSGCPSDCALAAVADLGFFAQCEEGVRGFSVRAGGGLSPQPAVGVQIEDFVQDDEIFEVVEVVIQLLDADDGRTPSLEAGLRRVIERMGKAEFVHCYREHRARIRETGLPPNVLKVNHQMRQSPARSAEECVQVPPASDVRAEPPDGFYSLRVRLPLGDVAAGDLARVAQLARGYGAGIVCGTAQQDLLIPSVSKDHLEAIRHELCGLDFDCSVT